MGPGVRKFVFHFLLKMVSIPKHGAAGWGADLFQKTVVDDCLTDIRFYSPTTSLKDYWSASASNCALRCQELGPRCVKFLQCTNREKNCRPVSSTNLSRASVEPEDCSCFLKLNQPCENGGRLETGGRCECPRGYYGDKCQLIYTDCGEATGLGTGYYVIKPPKTAFPFPVHCDFSGNISYTSILKRKKPKAHWLFRWNSYQSGFGNVKYDLWVGLRQIHLLVREKPRMELKIGMTCDFNYSGVFSQHTVRFSDFSIGNEASNYTIRLRGFSTGSERGEELREALASVDGQPFSTLDRDSTGNDCPKLTGSGWWFGADCTTGNLNGPFVGKFLTGENRTVHLLTWNVGGTIIRIRKTFMKIGETDAV